MPINLASLGSNGAIEVGERLLYRAQEVQRHLSPMHVLKLAYISHGWMLGLLHEPLFGEEVEAWRYGPVVPRLYARFRKYGRGKIPEGGALHGDYLSGKKQQVIDQVFDGYCHYTALELSDLTHQPDSPWAATKALSLRVIPNDLIEQYYREKANRVLGRGKEGQV